jgi:hypothetical protein
MSDEAAAPGPAIEWTEHEVMLWETARIVGAILRGETLSSKHCNFALSLSDDFSEALLATGGFQRDWLGAIGDGTYRTNTTVVGGFSPVGVMLGAATLGASALGNASRKSKAAADASIVWRQLDSGWLHVSTRGFYLETRSQLHPFAFWSIQRIDLLGAGAVQWSAASCNGTVQTYRLSSVCAELAFVLWALARCPTHHQFLGMTWLPQAFMERVRFAGVVDALGGGSLGIGGSQ